MQRQNLNQQLQQQQQQQVQQYSTQEYSHSSQEQHQQQRISRTEQHVQRSQITTQQRGQSVCLLLACHPSDSPRANRRGVVRSGLPPPRSAYGFQQVVMDSGIHTVDLESPLFPALETEFPLNPISFKANTLFSFRFYHYLKSLHVKKLRFKAFNLCVTKFNVNLVVLTD